MASYEAAAGSVVDAIAGAGLSAATVAAISGLIGSLTDANGQVDVFNWTEGNLTNPADAGSSPVIVQDANSSANLTFGPTSPVQAMVVGALGNSTVAFETSKDVAVTLQGGENNSVSTAAGNDTVIIQNGTATVDTGAGNDTIFIDSGAAGAATVNAGDGFDVVQMVGERASSHHFSYSNGHFVMNSNMALNMLDVNIVGFDTAGNGLLDQATVLAASVEDSLIAKLYSVVRGEDGVLDQLVPAGSTLTADAQLAGIEFWMDQFNGQSLQHTVYSFLNSEEFHSKFDGMDNTQYVTTLFNNLGLSATDTVNGMTLADLANACASENGRYDVAWAIAASTEATNILGANGENYVIDATGLTFDDPLA